MTRADEATTRLGFSQALAALRIPEFRRFFLAALISNSGTWLQGLALPFVIFEITESGTWVGVSVFALLLPMAAAGPVAGPLADRIARRNILIVTQSALALIALLLATLWWSGVRGPWAYVGVSVLYGVGNGFTLPAWQAYVADLVPRENLMNAITLNSAQFNAARAIGPSIGGIVLATLGPGWSFAGNALSFIFVVATLRTLTTGVSTRSMARESTLRSFTSGFGYARTRPVIVTGYIVAGLLAVLGGTLVHVHLVLFAEEVFKVSELRFGLLVSTFGLGAVAVAPWLTTRATALPKAHVLLAGLAGYGIAEVALVATTSYLVGLVGVLIAGAAHLTIATVTNTTIQLRVDEAMRGRVIAMYLIVLTLGIPIGAIVQGPLAESFGPRAVVGTMGALMLASTTWLLVSGRAATFDEE